MSLSHVSLATHTNLFDNSTHSGLTESYVAITIYPTCSDRHTQSRRPTALPYTTRSLNMSRQSRNSAHLHRLLHKTASSKVDMATVSNLRLKGNRGKGTTCIRRSVAS